jgi:hypothetical protein
MHWRGWGRRRLCARCARAPDLSVGAGGGMAVPTSPLLDSIGAGVGGGALALWSV